MDAVYGDEAIQPLTHLFTTLLWRGTDSVEEALIRLIETAEVVEQRFNDSRDVEISALSEGLNQ